jgi:hypothetical protein
VIIRAASRPLLPMKSRVSSRLWVQPCPVRAAVHARQRGDRSASRRPSSIAFGARCIKVGPTSKGPELGELMQFLEIDNPSEDAQSAPAGTHAASRRRSNPNRNPRRSTRATSIPLQRQVCGEPRWSCDPCTSAELSPSLEACCLVRTAFEATEAEMISAQAGEMSNFLRARVTATYMM